MSENDARQWLQDNQRYLTAALALESAVLSAAAGQESGDVEELRTKMVAIHSGMSAPPALERLRVLCNLSVFECRLLLWCAGAELDAGFAQKLALAQQDAARRRPCFSLALAVLPEGHWSALSPSAPLRYYRLVQPVVGAGLSSAPLQIDERILHYLMGVSQVDERLSGSLRELDAPGWEDESLRSTAERVAGVWRRADEHSELAVIELTGTDGATRQAAARLACANLGLRLFWLPAQFLPVEARELEEWMRLWEREALLEGCALLVECDELDEHSPQAAGLARLVETGHGALILSSRTRRPAGERDRLSFELPGASAAEQEQAWRRELGPGAARFNGQLSRLTVQFQLSAAAIHHAAAAFDRETGSFEDLWQACREQSRPRLEELAQRIQSPARWHDLVLPALQENLLHQIAAQVHQRQRVYQDWGFAARSSRGLGTSAVFAGPSGTGKTLAAEVLANELSLDLYRIDLSAVVSKYIGETEKNLRRLFDAAENGGAILFFDEADALFGKRSEVKDSHDRYANIEVSYLLQRMEAYRGLSILATNLPDALDPAFLRRLRFIINFPYPGGAQRLQIWQRIFPADVPLGEIDRAALARLDLAGGSIYNVALQAAFLAAEEGGRLEMSHILEAARGEYMRLEKPFPLEKGVQPR